jgi:hypothetical protein
VDNLLATFFLARLRGPYKEAADEYKEYGNDSPMYQAYIAGPEYVKYYEQAVQLSAVYMAALYEVYATLSAGKDFTPAREKRFRQIVSGEDLSCPLQGDILGRAREELTKGKTGAKYEPLFEKS